MTAPDTPRDSDAERLMQLQKWRHAGGKSFDINWPDDLWLALRELDARAAALREYRAEIDALREGLTHLRDIELPDAVSEARAECSQKIEAWLRKKANSGDRYSQSNADVRRIAGWYDDVADAIARGEHERRDAG